MPSEVLFSKIVVSNLRESFDFYTKVIGLREVELPGPPHPRIDDPSPKDPVVEVCLNFTASLADPYVCLIRSKDLVPAREYTKLTCIGIKTSDARSTVKRVKAAGYSVTMEVTQFMGLLAGVVSDPDGYSVELIEAHGGEPLKH
jgi:predicted enzyme related to lactoylglutathione lyase